MDAARLFRLAAAGFVLLAIALTALQLARPAPPAPPAWTPRPSQPVQAPAPELARCQALGEAGARDAGCLAAWAETRRRFLGLPAAAQKE